MKTTIKALALAFSDGKFVTAEFITAEGKQSSISACDVYRFENEKLVQINSYCIRGKSGQD
jgi:hypothetical protein